MSFEELKSFEEKTGLLPALLFSVPTGCKHNALPCCSEARRLTADVRHTAGSQQPGSAPPSSLQFSGDGQLLPLVTPAGARATPSLAQEFLLQFCALLPGADRCGRCSSLP